MIRSKSRTLAGFIVAGPLAVLLLAAARPDDSAKGIRILYPAPGSAVAGAVRFIVAADRTAPAPRAMLDGKPLTLSRLIFAESWALPGKLKATSALVGDRSTCAVYSAEFTAAPGPHDLTVGDKKVRMVGVKDLKGSLPNTAVRLASHRLLSQSDSKLDCSACHQQTGDQLGVVDTPAVCAPCHDETSVQLIHGHVPKPLGKCAMCHDPHGTVLPKLLVDTKEKLCSKCHGSGHFRG